MFASFCSRVIAENAIFKHETVSEVIFIFLQFCAIFIEN